MCGQSLPRGLRSPKTMATAVQARRNVSLKTPECVGRLVNRNLNDLVVMYIGTYSLSGKYVLQEYNVFAGNITQ